MEAGLVASPEDYPWSSYRFYLAPAPAGPMQQILVDVEPVLQLFSEDPQGSQRGYERFVREGMAKT